MSSAAESHPAQAYPLYWERAGHLRAAIDMLDSYTY